MRELQKDMCTNLVRWAFHNATDGLGKPWKIFPVAAPLMVKLTWFSRTCVFANSDARNPDERNGSFTGFSRSMSLKNW